MTGEEALALGGGGEVISVEALVGVEEALGGGEGSSCRGRIWVENRGIGVSKGQINGSRNEGTGGRQVTTEQINFKRVGAISASVRAPSKSYTHSATSTSASLLRM